MQVFQFLSYREMCTKKLGQPRGHLIALGQQHKGLSCGPSHFPGHVSNRNAPSGPKEPDSRSTLMLRLGTDQRSLRWAGEGVMEQPTWARPGRHMPSHR